MFKIESLKYKYHDGTRALNSITLDIYKGEMFAILGANGSGKTTLLKHLNGLLKPSAGTVFFEGKSLKKINKKDIFQRIGMIFQDPNDQLFAPSVYEDVAFGPMNMNLSKDEIDKRVISSLEMVGMSDFKQKGVNALSFGQKRRVCIAGTLAMKPQVLVLDEPTCGLDPSGVTSLITLLRTLCTKHGITIIMATNIVDLVPVYIDRLAVLDKGTVLRIGTPEEVFSNTKDISQASLELPEIGKLMQQLRDKDKIPMDNLPLTVGEARTFLSKHINS